MVLDRIKGLRGILFKKISEGAKEEPLPGFRLEKSTRIVEFPISDDITQINVTYSLLEPFAYANIKWMPEEKELVYNVIEPQLSDDDRKIYEKIADALIQLVDVDLSALKEANKAIEYLQKQFNKVVKDYGLRLTQNQYIKIMYFVYRNFLGYNEIDALMQDPNIEDISCDGMNIPIYVVHRKYGSIKTNVFFNNFDELREFVIKLAERCGRYVSYAEPILGGTLPDGSRVSATLAGDVATRGPTLTIRKFGEKPLSPVEQLELNTLDSEVLAYFWYLVEHGANMLFVGGTATGKTTLLNSICMLIPPEKKIVSIEDTREIRIPHQHWVSGLARTGFGIPLASGEKYGEITMFDLLRESFRQNPDYVIVGETRGKEAYVMFQGMASGHTSLSTFHANSVDAVVKRLTSPPIELSATLIESLNVVAIMTHAKEIGKGARRVKEVVEIISVDPKTEEVKTNLVFLWSPTTDTFTKVNDSQIITKIVESRGGEIEEAKIELGRRKIVLEWMLSKNIKDYLEVVRYVNMYYKEPAKLFQLIGKFEEFKREEKKKIAEIQPIETETELVGAEAQPAEVPTEIEIKPAETEIKPVMIPKKIVRGEKQKKTSILELLGYKIVRERPH